VSISTQYTLQEN